MKPRVFVLSSGGIDSTALLHYYISHGEKPTAIHFQYDQPNLISEKKAIETVSKYYELEYKIYTLGFPIIKKGYEFVGRNALFVLAAASIVGDPSRISLGIHSNTDYYDCSPNFVHSMQDLLDGYFAGAVQIETPFIKYSKKDVIDFAINNGVPLDLTYSCLSQNSPPCCKCPACLDRMKYLEN